MISCVRHSLGASKVMAIILGIVAMVGISTATTMPSTVRKVGFLMNKGQWPEEVLFMARTPNLNVWITRKGLVFDQFLIQAASATREGHVIRAVWKGIDESRASVVGEGEARARVNYITSQRPEQWSQEVPIYKRVRIRDLYPGIDAVYYIENGNVRYDLDIRPGADLRKVNLAFEGHPSVDVENTTLKVGTRFGQIIMSDLFAYQEGNKAKGVNARFMATGDGVRFDIPDYNSSRHLTIDPVVYGSYIGGDNEDRVVAIEKMPGGNIAVAGWTWKTSFPENAGEYSSTIQGGQDAYVAIMDPTLSRVLHYTFLGGANDDRAADLDVDAQGNIYVTGETVSTDFPVTSGSVGQMYVGGTDVFVVKLDATATNLLLGTYVGGGKEDIPYAMAVDDQGNIIVCGSTTSAAGFPTTNGYQRTFGGQTDGFLTKIATAGATYRFSTYFGKDGIEYFTDVAVDGTGAIFLTGLTNSTTFETFPKPTMWNQNQRPYDRTYNGGASDAIIVKFRANDGGLEFSTYFGGAGDDVGRGVYTDALSRVYAVGETTSNDLPATAGFQQTRAGGKDAFFTIISDDGKELVGCTYYGGTGDEIVAGCEPDAANGAVIVGTTTSVGLKVEGAGSSSERKGGVDAFVASVSTAALKFATVFGGSGNDTPTDVVVDANDDYYIGGYTMSTDMPSGLTPFQGGYGGGSTDGFLTKYAKGTMDLQVPRGGEAWCIGTNQAISWGVLEGAVDTYTLELSPDNGQTWKELAKNITTKTYLWKPDTSLVPGGQYKIRLWSSRGHLSVSAATFTLNAPPAITTQPQAVSGCEGAEAKLTVDVKGTNVRYQWRRNGGNINGATAATYVIPSLTAANAGKYDVVVTGACNPSVTSHQVDVAVSAATAITKQPENVTVEKNAPFTLSVEASGGGLTYQWKLNGENISAPKGTARQLTVSSAQQFDEGSYTCVVTGTCGTATSNAVTVSVTTVGVDEEPAVAASAVRLLGPTPASDVVRIQCTFRTSSAATLRIVDERGRVVSVADLGNVDAGLRTLDIPVGELGSGVYLFEINGGGLHDAVRGVVAR